MYRIILLLIVIMLLFCTVACAETKYITATGEYTMGEGETITNAKDMALRQAMRSATEQVGVYVESYSKVVNAQLTKDEVNVLSSSVMEIIKKEYAAPQPVGGGFRYACTITAKVTSDNIDLLRSSKQLKADQDAQRYAQEQQQMADLMAQLSQLKSQLSEVKTDQQKQNYIAQVVQLSQKIDVVARSQTNLSAKQWYDIATEYYAKGNDALATNLLNKALTIDNGYYDALVMRGNIYLKTGNKDKAAADFIAAIKIEPHDTTTLNKLYDICAAANDQQGMMRYLNLLIDADGSNANYYTQRASLQTTLGQNQQAISDYSLALQCSSEKKAIYIARAKVYEKSGNFESAKQDYLMAYAPEATLRINNNPNDYEAYLSRAKALYVNDRYDMALADLSVLLNIDSQNEEALCLKARILLADKEYLQTVSLCTAVLDKNPLFKNAYLVRADAYAALGKIEEAKKDSESWIALCSVTLIKAKEMVNTIAFSPDSKFIASGGYDFDITIWNVGDHNRFKILSGVQANINSIAYSPDGKYIASYSSDNAVILWNVDTATSTLLGIDGDYSGRRNVAFSVDGKIISSGSDNGLNLYDTSSRKKILTLFEGVNFGMIAYSPNGKYLAGTIRDGKNGIAIFDAEIKQQLKPIGLIGDYDNVAFSPDGKHFAATLPNGDRGFDNLYDIYIMEIDKKAKPNLLTGQTSISSIAYSPDGKYLTSGSFNKTVNIWSLLSLQCIATLNVDGHVSSVAFSPDGKYLACGSAVGENGIKLWQLDLMYPDETLKNNLPTSSEVLNASSSKTIPASFTSNNSKLKLLSYKRDGDDLIGVVANDADGDLSGVAMKVTIAIVGDFSFDVQGQDSIEKLQRFHDWNFRVKGIFTNVDADTKWKLVSSSLVNG